MASDFKVKSNSEFTPESNSPISPEISTSPISPEISTTFDSQEYFKAITSNMEKSPPPLKKQDEPRPEGRGFLFSDKTEQAGRKITEESEPLRAPLETTPLEAVFKEMEEKPYRNIPDQKTQRETRLSFQAKLKKLVMEELFQTVSERINQQLQIVGKSELHCFMKFNDQSNEYSLKIFYSNSEDSEVTTQRNQKYAVLNKNLRVLVGNVCYKLIICYMEGKNAADLRNKNTELHESYPEKIDSFLTTLDPIPHSKLLLNDVLREMSRKLFEKGNQNKLSYFTKKVKKALLEIEFQKNCYYNNKRLIKNKMQDAVYVVDSSHGLDNYSLKVHLLENASQNTEVLMEVFSKHIVKLCKGYHKMVNVITNSLIVAYQKGATYKEFLTQLISIERWTIIAENKVTSFNTAPNNHYEEIRVDQIKTMKNWVELIKNYELTAKEIYEIELQVKDAKKAAMELIEEERLENLKSEKKQKKKKIPSRNYKSPKHSWEEIPDKLEAPIRPTPTSMPISIPRTRPYPIHRRLDDWVKKNPENYRHNKNYKNGRAVHPYKSMPIAQLIEQGRNHCPKVFPGLLSDVTTRKKYCKLLPKIDLSDDPKIDLSDDTFIVNCTQVFVEKDEIKFKDGVTALGSSKNNTIYHSLFKEQRNGTPDNQERTKEYKILLEKAKAYKSWTTVGGYNEIDNKNGVRTYCFDHSEHLLIIYPRS